MNFWDDVYGFKMSCMKTEVVSQTAVDVIEANKVITLPCLVKVRVWWCFSTVAPFCFKCVYQFFL